MKRLLITSTDLMMGQFLLPHVQFLAARGFSVEIACSEVGGRLAQIRAALPEIPVHSVNLGRSPLRPGNLLGYLELKKRILEGNYDIIWTNEPVMGAVTRLAAWGSGAKVVYLCHGFHFYRGGSWWNWLAYYPIELILSHATDLLVTINREDAALASNMGAATAYLPGIGLDTARLESPAGNIRAELGLPKEDILVVSVGELNKNKDHATAIRAVAALKDPKIHYAICGTGPLRRELEKLAAGLEIGNKVHFLGYRRDLGRVFAGADLFVHPSRRDGLGLAALEAAYCGVPLVVSDIRGLRDFVPADFRVKAGDVDAFAEMIRVQLAHPRPLDRAVTEKYRLETVREELLYLLKNL